MTVTYQLGLEGIDWAALKNRLNEDDFDNGRSPDQLQRSFQNSYAACFAIVGGKVIGKARLISDGICNAYLVDVWTYSPFRHRGIASEMIRTLSRTVQGQHIYLQADDDLIPFYRQLGFQAQPNGLSMVVGEWLNAEEPA